MIKKKSIEKIRSTFDSRKAPVNILDNNNIYPGTYVSEEVELGKNNTVLPGTIIISDVEIGDNNIIGPYAVIGTPAQHRSYYEEGIDHSDYKIKIGSDNVIREFVTVHNPTIRNTIIGDDCMLMKGSHVPHDAALGNGVTLTNTAEVAGKSNFMDYTTIGLITAVHQYSVIGSYAMVGLQSALVKDVPPFLTYIEKNNACHGVNEVGMDRNGFTKEEIKDVYEYYVNEKPLTGKLGSIMEEFEYLREENRKLFDGESKRKLFPVNLGKSYEKFLKTYEE